MKPKTQLNKPRPHWQQESWTACLEDVPAEQTIPITGDKLQKGARSLDELMRLRELHDQRRESQEECLEDGNEKARAETVQEKQRLMIGKMKSIMMENEE